MKRFILTALAALSLVGCASTGTSTVGTATAQQTPAQIAAQICVPLQVAIAGLQADPALSTSTLSALTSAAPKVATTCAIAAQATSTDVASLETLAFNTIMPILAADPKYQAAYADLLAVKIIITAIQQAQTAAQMGGTVAPVTTQAQ